MAGDFYTLKLIADIDDKKSDSEIQKYISEIQKKVSTDEKSKLKITVTPIMDRVQDPNNAKKYIDVQKDLVTVQATYNNPLVPVSVGTPVPVILRAIPLPDQVPP